MHRAHSLTALLLLFTAARAGADVRMTEAWRFKAGATIGPPTLYRAIEGGPIQGTVFTVTDGRLVMLDGKGNVAWAHPIARLSHATPAIADVDGDRQCEVIVADFDGLLRCLSGTGKVKWTQQLRGGVFQQAGAGICDLEGDGSKEIIVGDRTGKIWCFNGRGGVRWTLDLGRRWVSSPAFADLDGDGRREIVIGEVDDHLYCLDASGQWRWEVWSDDEVFGNSGCTVADLTGDGLPEVLVGGGLNHFLALDGRTGKHVSEINTKQHINCSMAAGDLDQDGRTDVVFGTRQGTLWRIGANGRVVWQKQYTHSILTGLCIADLSEEPGLEIVVPVAGSHLSVADCEGNEVASHPMGYGSDSAPAVGDIDGDGYLEIVAGDAGDTHLVCLRTNAPAKPGAVIWESFRGDAACTGNPSNVHAAHRAAARIAASQGAHLALTAPPTWLAGANECVYQAENPDAKRLLLSVSCTKPGGTVERHFRHSAGATDALKCSISVDRGGPYQVEAQLLDVDQRSLLASNRFSQTVDLFARDLRQAEQPLAALDGLVSDLGDAGPAIVSHLKQTRLETLGHIRELRTAKATRLRPEPMARIIADAAASRQGISRTLALAEVIRARRRAGLNHTFVAWPAFAWHHFDGKNALPPAEPEPEREIEMDAYIGEREWAAINITSFADRLSRFRLALIPATDAETRAQMPSASLQVFEAVEAPTLDSRMVADALVPLDDSGMVAIAPWESRQIWVRVWAQDAQPGQYAATLKITSVEPVPTSQQIPLRIRIWPIEIPTPGRLRFVNWVPSAGPDEAFRDALAREVIAHGVNVFPCGSPSPRFDSAGRLLAPIDYSDHDAFVRRFVGRGKFLFGVPQHRVKVEGAEMFSQPWIAAYRTYLAEWRNHLSELGIPTDDFYLYPVDEASIAGSEALRELTETARITKQIDPNIGIFANPSMGATVEGLTELSHYVDVWCPSQELMDREGKPLLDFFKRTADEVWFYDARGASRTLSGLAFFRRQAWQAWHHGLDGMGFFACMASPDLAWIGPSSDYFDVMYPGLKPISSKRYEAASDGREDFEAMCILREAAQNAKQAGLHAEAVQEAEELLTVQAEQVWQAIDRMDDRGEVMTDGSEAQEVARMLRDFRRRAAALTVALSAR